MAALTPDVGSGQIVQPSPVSAISVNIDRNPIGARSMNANSKRQSVTRKGSRTPSAERRLKELGIKLPAPPEPFGTYAEAVQTGNLLFLSGMLPTAGHGAKFVGRVGTERDVEEARKAAPRRAQRPRGRAPAFGFARCSDTHRPARRVRGHLGRCPRPAENC